MTPRPRSAGDRVASAIDAVLDWAERIVIGGLVVTALGLGTMQVVLRYVFNTGFEWNEAIFVLVTVAAMLMAGARAVRENAHVRVDIVHVIVSARTSRILDIVAYSASLALCLFYVWCGYLFVSFARMMGTASPETGIPDWMIYAVMPVAMSLFSVRFILKIRAIALGTERHEAHADISAFDAGDAR
ncbi:TRAP transporter small permease [Acuticoccus kandeliae]|uniref:TRAP transporter small permease n=1 Tax=Acuticoccus kandeliae TaxID=2073160 RepID=UPI0013003F63|nr:TRAP transporter small permease [Acuticoccus kandeliae]